MTETKLKCKNKYTNETEKYFKTWIALQKRAFRLWDIPFQ